MLSNLSTYKKYYEFFTHIRAGVPCAAFGISSGERVLLLNAFKSFVYVVDNYVEAREALRELNDFCKEEIVYLPSYDDVLVYKRSTDRSVQYNRNTALYKILKGARGVVASAEALTQPYPDCAEFKLLCFTLETGREYQRKELLSRLIECGYKRSAFVEEVGEFSLRGDILDINNPLYDKPQRIEFFGDTVENMRFFDPSALTSVERIEKVELFPLCNIFPAHHKKALGALNATGLTGEAGVRFESIKGELNAEPDNPYMFCYGRHSPLSDYLADNVTLFWNEPTSLGARVSRLYKEFYGRIPYLMEKGEVSAAAEKQLIPENSCFSEFSCRQAAFQGLPSASFFKAREIVSFNSSPLPSYRNSFEELSQNIRGWQRHGYEIAVMTGNYENAERLRYELYNADCPLKIGEGLSSSLHEGSIIPLPFSQGFINHADKLVVIGQNQIYTKAPAAKKLAKKSREAFLSVEAGDYVVHETHGIGLCQGVITVENEGGAKDYIAVKYKNDDMLYVPAESTDLLTRYSGGEPKLSALGGGEFEKLKARVKGNIKALAIDLAKLYSEREQKRGHRYIEDEYLSREFAEAFPFTETADQLRCITEITRDLESDKIMDRLLCGDVGFGKTEVAMRAAFKVVANGYQAAVLVPTTILAEQHFETFKKRFEPFNLKLECLNRFRTKEQQKEIIKAVKDGYVDIIIGTHRLLSKDIVFDRLGILILDEEQRFGVAHKEHLKALKTNIDVLTLTATPIPRTLHMSLTGIRDISTISTPPKERLPVESFVVEDSPALIRDIIIRELSRDGQIFLVYNRVESIEAFSAKIRKLVPEARCIVGHGQMDSDTLEKNIVAFARGEYNVLICTTIIENGIDMPNANTLIVYDADYLGLSQLYQLRGRVGRSNRLAYAYFIYRDNKIISADSFKRLNSIMQYSELGSGFKIAMKDLEIRGAGNVLGREQHGHMEKVGYEMYVKLLKEVVAEVKGEDLRPSVQTVIDADIDARVPIDYIEDSSRRMDFYRRLSDMDNGKDELIRELIDVYGEPPKSVYNLLELAEVKYAASKAGISAVIAKSNSLRLEFASKSYFEQKEVLSVLQRLGNTAAVDGSGSKIAIALKLKKSSALYALTAAKTVITEILLSKQQH